MKSYRLIVFDLDGVLFRGGTPIEGASEALQSLRGKSIEFRFLTNNSSQTRVAFAKKLQGFGISAEPGEIYNSGYGAARFLGRTSAFVVGEDGLREELSAGGVELVNNGPAKWVVAGVCWGLTYAMVDEAQWRIRKGARFLATNPDPVYPIEDGRVKPGAGAVIAAIATAAGKQPETVIGKPEPTLVELILGDTGIAASETLLVGDRIDTDIECARRAGCDSALVLTGVTNKQDAERIESRPTYILDSVADISG